MNHVPNILLNLFLEQNQRKLECISVKSCMKSLCHGFQFNFFNELSLLKEHAYLQEPIKKNYRNVQVLVS